MSTPPRPIVALVSAETAPPLRAALERAGYEVPLAYACDFRASKTAFSTFVETYKPHVIVLDLQPPADDALKDLLSFWAVRTTEGRPLVVACSDEETRRNLPVDCLPIGSSPEPVLRAVEDALRRAA